jgi:pilus assembly protein Flp/PilA
LRRNGGSVRFTPPRGSGPTVPRIIPRSDRSPLLCSLGFTRKTAPCVTDSWQRGRTAQVGCHPPLTHEGTLVEMLRYIRQVMRSGHDRGASAVEYGLMVAAIAAVIVGIVFGLGTLVKSAFSTTCTNIKNSVPTTATCT